MSSGHTAAIVLAAGASRRMGATKQLLDVAGEPMVRRAVRTATSAGLSPVVVVVGHDEARVRVALDGMPCHVVVNAEFTGPTSTSLHAGIAALEPGVEAFVVLLADMVRVTPAMVRALVPAPDAGSAPLAVSRYGDVLAPPLLFRRSLWPELLAWHGEGCGKSVVRAHRHEAVMHDWPEAALRDVDTPDDYAALLADAGDGVA
ncbi:MAG: nucleotidyltransferase family protein [Gemmatimonadaceae bacterium]|nr:nucleotidyltransferase family protein [Gemmatimonadaceae bacterium]